LIREYFDYKQRCIKKFPTTPKSIVGFHYHHIIEQWQNVHTSEQESKTLKHRLLLVFFGRPSWSSQRMGSPALVMDSQPSIRKFGQGALDDHISSALIARNLQWNIAAYAAWEEDQPLLLNFATTSAYKPHLQFSHVARRRKFPEALLLPYNKYLNSSITRLGYDNLYVNSSFSPFQHLKICYNYILRVKAVVTLLWYFVLRLCIYGSCFIVNVYLNTIMLWVINTFHYILKFLSWNVIMKPQKPQFTRSFGL
jgi:hypothetical protein